VPSHKRERRGLERERGSHLVHRPVATPGDNGRDAAGNGRTRELTRVTAAFRDEHVGRIASSRRQEGARLRSARTRHLDAATRAGYGIDNDGYRDRRRSTLGGINHTSSPGRREVRPCTAM
jgi:hypothetical protein